MGREHCPWGWSFLLAGQTPGPDGCPIRFHVRARRGARLMVMVDGEVDGAPYDDKEKDQSELKS